MKGLFVTGTDTDVGKTWVGRLIVQALIEKGAKLQPRKPIESGWPTNIDKVTSTDAWHLANAANKLDQLDTICPNRFPAPLSPVRAARMVNQSLSLDKVAKQCLDNLQHDDFLYVEGAGGFYSPLVEDGLNADLASKLKLPIVLVANNRLGCMNHILMTHEAMQNRDLNLLAVILNQVEAIDHDTAMNNQEDLQEYLTQPVFSLRHGQTTLPAPLVNLLY
ncbi:dethiobiotin synthase [Leucothrix arctica]|uniref:ATP-dependent dethiobiotin synthetase BioD n=1 Tax=Leucothrix arctica TaxID=1481894 RepID=A0A317CCN3_9GAMM|nr:dethiobiotin synthase [Leucothrix arctica]PWQ96384.1 dethiobiotin synthase [Leucothrix arctica]